MDTSHGRLTRWLYLRRSQFLLAMDTDELVARLREATKDAIRGSEAVGVAYSGGVDSAVIASLASESARVVCYTCAVAGSHDHMRAPATAAEEGLELHMVMMDRGTLTEAVRKVCEVLETENPLKAAFTVPIMCALEACAEKVVLVGSGADELFGGYAKYLEDCDPETSMATDLEVALADLGRLRAYAGSVGKRLEAPFVAPGVISFAKGIPLERKLSAGNRKATLRDAAKALGVLSHDSPKKAAQYSSGVMKEMRAMAKERGMDLGDWTAEVASNSRRIP